METCHIAVGSLSFWELIFLIPLACIGSFTLGQQAKELIYRMIVRRRNQT